MGTRLYELDVTVPAGTAQITPQVTPWPLENAQLVQIELIVPPGHVALTGIRILQAQQQIIPWGNLSYLRMDSEKLVIPFNGEIGANALSINTFNTDIFAHTFYLRATIQDLPLPGANQTPGPPIVASALLTGAGVPLSSAAGG